MKVIERFPHRVREIENVWITMADGCRLAARVWMPEDAPENPVPAILEYIPYRKRDETRERDEPMHRYFAGHGYAALRVDVRGSGDSEGSLLDEYTPQELEDGVQVIRWIASQAWCDGQVGMMGKSWGGFNSLQVAALQPPELKAIITVCSTDDRYADDAHYKGGCLLNENLVWGSVLLTNAAKPPDPEIAGAQWRQAWLYRLENLRLFMDVWLEHPFRDDYWRHGSVCEDFSKIKCPVYAVGGWADGYSNAIPRLMAGLSVPRKALIGPWAHVYPHDGRPGPAIGFLQEAVRWWDQWLKGRDSGVTNEPAYRVWMQERVSPGPSYEEVPGRWVAEETWPVLRAENVPHRHTKKLHLSPRRLTSREAAAEPVEVRTPSTVGFTAGRWCSFGAEGDMPSDQRSDDDQSVVFDSDVLESRVEILGAPEVVLVLAADREQGLVALRLNDVAPDGSSLRVTYGVLNLAHREGHDFPQPLKPGERYRVRVRLNDTAYAFPPGHRIRLAVSTSYWPMLWPSPYRVSLTLRTDASFVEMPVRTPRREDARLRVFGKPESAPPPRTTDRHPGGVKEWTDRDPRTKELLHTIETDVDDEGRLALTRFDSIGVEFGHSMTESYRIREDDPLSARVDIRHEAVTRGESWSTRVETWTQFSSTRTTFRLQAEVKAYEGDERLFSRRWDTSTERKLV